MIEFTWNFNNLNDLKKLVGTYLIKGTEFTNKVVDDAISVGYRLFDTAENYRNEEYLGVAFKNSLEKYNLTRKDIFITSKFGKWSKIY